MFETIVVGVSHVVSGRDAVALAARLRAPADAVALLHVQVVSKAPARDSGAVVATAKRLIALDRLTQLADEFAIAAEVVCVEARAVRDGLYEFARRHHADLLVVRASHLDELSRDFIGGDTKELVDAAPCAVAVAPAGYLATGRPITTIGVAYDGSAGSEQALALARKLAAEDGAELWAFEAVSAAPYAHHPADAAGGPGQPAAAIRRRLAARGDLEPDARTGDAVEELAPYERSPDLLVIGAYKYELIDHLMRVSVSEELADDPAAPLLVLPVPSVSQHGAQQAGMISASARAPRGDQAHGRG